MIYGASTDRSTRTGGREAKPLGLSTIVQRICTSLLMLQWAKIDVGLRQLVIVELIKLSYHYQVPVILPTDI